MIPLLRSVLLVLIPLVASFAAVPAAYAYDLCGDDMAVCIEREGACVTVVYRYAYDFTAGGANCPVVSSGPHGVGACESAWAGAGGRGGFRGAAVSLCGGMDSEGNACVTPYVQVNADPSGPKTLCLA